MGKASQSGKMGHQLISGMHHAILALSRQGLNVVADHVLVEKRWLDECVRMFYDQPAYLIGLRCPLDVLEQRENNRAKDRTPGQAKKQINLVHAHEIYDLEVDTSRYNIEECASLIKDRIKSGVPPSALKKLYLHTTQPA